jgi:SAM-dependent methyltransferase
MKQSWFKIWNNKNITEIEQLSKNYINLYKVIYPRMNSSQITNYMKFLFKKQNFKSFFDFGSGNGAILHYVYNHLNCKKIFSYDISKNFLKIQKKVFGSKINIIDFNKFYFKKKVDLTLCNSVFQYFKNKKKVFKCIEKLIKISNNVIISDIISSKGYKKFLKEKLIRENISSIDFKKKYENLKHVTFVKKDFVYLKNKFKIKILFKPMPLYHPDAKYRFLVYIKN